MLLADAFDDTISGLVGLAVILGLYFAPTVVAFVREVPNKWSVVVINTLLGWTLIGWVVALAMAARSVPRPEPPAPPPPSRDCPNCKRAMPRGEAVCPHCGNESKPWVFHAGVWWTKGPGASDEWQWIDESAKIGRWYKDGTPSNPAATDMTPNLRIDPAVVKPPHEAPSREAQAGASSQQGDSVATELERLADLHARGALSDEQFETAKTRLLEA